MQLPLVSPVTGYGKPDAKILYSMSHRSIDALADFESGSRGSRLEVFNEVQNLYFLMN